MSSIVSILLVSFSQMSCLSAVVRIWDSRLQNNCLIIWNGDTDRRGKVAGPALSHASRRNDRSSIIWRKSSERDLVVVSVGRTRVSLFSQMALDLWQRLVWPQSRSIDQGIQETELFSDSFQWVSHASLQQSAHHSLKNLRELSLHVRNCCF